MNALDMKLESKDTDLATSGRCTEGVAKKFKNTRKKVNPINCVDKELQQTGNGLRCGPIPMTGFDAKECWTFQPINAKKKRSKKVTEHGKMETKTEKVQERLELSLSDETKKKIIAILNDIRLLSDVEKLLLYLQLPTGASFDEDPLKQKYLGNPLGKKADEEGTLAVTWIQSHLEEDPDVSLPKQEVYDEYQSYCEVTGNEALCAADFGKVMKQIFPSVKPRRLGTRGNSRYCYSGLRKKITVQPPSLSDLQVKKENSKSDQDTSDDIMTAACHVLLEWAEKLLDVKFTSVKEVASYLIDNMLVDNRSVAAFTLLLSSAPEQLEKSSTGTNLKWENRNKKSETQIHLQRKIQEKELIKEQKRKLQLQRSCLTTSYPGKSVFSKKKNLKSKKIGLINGQILKDEGSTSCSGNRCEKDDLSSESLPSNNESRMSSKMTDAYLTAKSSDNADKNQSSKFLLQCRSHGPHGKDIFSNPHSTLIDDMCDNPSKINETSKKKTNTNISALSDKTPVCISQSLPGFIIVPSLSQIQLKDTGKSGNKIPKYKRIQPKPLNEFPVSSTMRCRTGSLGSLMYKENKSRTDGRRSSLALLHSDFSLEISESNTCQKSTNFMSLVNNIKIKSVKSESNVNENLGSRSMNVKSFNVEDEDISSIELFSNRTTLLRSSKEQNSSNITKQSQKNNVITNTDDAGRVKRHFEDADFEVATKKPHLDDLMSSDISSESLSPWTKDINSINCNVNSNFPRNDTRDESGIINRRQDEVSIHELESDALIDYLHGAETENSNLINDESHISQVEPQLLVNNSQNQELEHSEFLNDEVKNHILNPEMNQLSQLRMLLEQNLPHTVTKPARAASEMIYSKKPSVLMHTNDLPLPLQVELIGKSRREMLSNDMSEVFLRNNNPYLNSECDIASSGGGLMSSQLNSESLLSNSSDLSSQGLITEQDLLTAMGEQLSLVKNPLQIQSSTKVLGDIGEHSGSFSFQSEISSGIMNIEQSSAQTQIPSVPPSPNTRRRAFNFMPISPRHTPVPDALCISQPVNCYSPVLVQQPRNMISVGVGPSQPPSNAGSPFVSPRSTPVPPSRSRHSSGQSSYSTSRHTPFQNIDSGVSSISSSPFISPQPTPVPVSRLRHNSSHGPCKTVTFSTANNNQMIPTLSSAIGHGPLRLRHSSGPGGPPMGFSLLSPRSAPLSPLVNETGLCSFNFPPVSESRSRHNSGLTTPLSPVSEQVSATNNSKQSHELPVNFENSLTSSEPIIIDNSRKEMISLNSHLRFARQRHASSSVIHSRISVVADPLAHEVQYFLKNESDNTFSRVDSNNRSRSVPLHQMLHNLANSSASFLPTEDLKTFSQTVINKHSENIPILGSSPSTPLISLTSDSLVLHCDKSLLQPVQNDWVNMDSTSDMEISATRKNLSGLMEVPMGDDLQTTLEDLRDCDTDFSKFAQELEQEFSHSGDGVL